MAIPDPHRVCESDLERADVGVSRAPVDTARRAPGGATGVIAAKTSSLRSDSGVLKMIGPMLWRANALELCGSGEART